MNNKGFTLIELLATIILLSSIISITAASDVGLINNSKESSYEILNKNIKIGAQAYFEECENVSIVGSTTITCPTFSTNADSTTKYFSITLKDLLTYGFLKSSTTDSSGNKIVENPMNNEDIGDCQIKVIKKINSSDTTTNYIIEDISGDNDNCPDEYAN